MPAVGRTAAAGLPCRPCPISGSLLWRLTTMPPLATATCWRQPPRTHQIWNNGVEEVPGKVQTGGDLRAERPVELAQRHGSGEEKADAGERPPVAPSASVSGGDQNGGDPWPGEEAGTLLRPGDHVPEPFEHGVQGHDEQLEAGRGEPVEGPRQAEEETYGGREVGQQGFHEVES